MNQEPKEEFDWKEILEKFIKQHQYLGEPKSIEDCERLDYDQTRCVYNFIKANCVPRSAWELEKQENDLWNSIADETVKDHIRYKKELGIANQEIARLTREYQVTCVDLTLAEKKIMLLRGMMKEAKDIADALVENNKKYGTDNETFNRLQAILTLQEGKK